MDLNNTFLHYMPYFLQQYYQFSFANPPYKLQKQRFFFQKNLIKEEHTQKTEKCQSQLSSLGLKENNNDVSPRNISSQEEKCQDKGIKKEKTLWTPKQDKILCDMARDNLEWNVIASKMKNRTGSMCYSRYRRLMMRPKIFYWKKQHNDLIIQLVQKIGYKWKQITKYLPNRTAKQIREHYMNYLRPNIDNSKWTEEEDIKLLKLEQQFGHKWKSFQKYLRGRTQNQIKSRFYGRLRHHIKTNIGPQIKHQTK